MRTAGKAIAGRSRGPDPRKPWCRSGRVGTLPAGQDRISGNGSCDARERYGGPSGSRKRLASLAQTSRGQNTGDRWTGPAADGPGRPRVRGDSRRLCADRPTFQSCVKSCRAASRCDPQTMRHNENSRSLVCAGKCRPIAFHGENQACVKAMPFASRVVVMMEETGARRRLSQEHWQVRKEPAARDFQSTARSDSHRCDLRQPQGSDVPGKVHALAGTP